MRIKIYLTIFIVFCLFSINTANASKNFEDFINTKNYKAINIENHKRYYMIHIPPDYNPVKSVPLLLVFHGAGGNPRSVETMTNMSVKADKEGFIVAYPAGRGYFCFNKIFLTWNVPKGFSCQNDKSGDIFFIKQLIEELQSKYNIDPKRIYMAGFSNGAALTYKITCALSDKIAAAGIISGFFDPEFYTNINPMPMVIFHGTKDKNILYNGGRPKKIIDIIERKIDRPLSDTISFWVKNNKCSGIPVREKTGNVVKDSYLNCENNADVVLYTLINAGHAWPGGKKTLFGGEYPSQEISATNTLWDFFTKHPKN